MKPIFALTLFAPIAITACGGEDPPTPAETRSRISADLGNVLRETNAALAGGAALPSSTSLDLLAHVVGSTPALPAMTDLSIDADASVKLLDEQVFTDANHVGDGVYQLPAELVCKRSTGVDADCAAKLAKLDLRIRTAVDGDTLTFALQIDADHDEPLRVALTHTSLALTVDFDELQRAEQAIASVLGTELPNTKLAGEITAAIAVISPAVIEAHLAIDRALAIQVASKGAALDGPDALGLTTGQAAGLTATLDGNTRTGGVTVALSKTMLRLPALDDKQTQLDLPGLSLTASFAAGQPLQVTHVSLGDSSTTVSVNGQRAETIDLNPSDGRAFDATVTRDDAAGTTRVAFSPRLDVHVAIDHAVLGDAPKLFDITGIRLDGGMTRRDDSDQVRIDGALAITTNPASYGITASAGQCVTTAEATDPATGAPYTQWTVGACL